MGFTPKDPRNGSFDEADSRLVVMAFAHDSRTKGNAATEIVKYFFQLHYGIEKDYRLPENLERRQLLLERLMGVDPSRAEPSPRHRLGRPVRRCGVACLRPPADVYAALLVAIGLVMAYTNSVENGGRRSRPGTTFTRGLMWAGIAVVVFILATRSTTAGSRRCPGRSTRSSSGCSC